MYIILTMNVVPFESRSMCTLHITTLSNRNQDSEAESSDKVRKHALPFDLIVPPQNQPIERGRCIEILNVIRGAAIAKRLVCDEVCMYPHVERTEAGGFESAVATTCAGGQGEEATEQVGGAMIAGGGWAEMGRWPPLQALPPATRPASVPINGGLRVPTLPPATFTSKKVKLTAPPPPLSRRAPIAYTPA